eukprot:TRINITY_DN10635_c0_g1_i1.p1 TRINITY_DN10635_c0_g1~~TRINITY_DN10635_c0_g1_i1.p1  ORF type:complete len:145 (+),score=29.96 TRINITY_DN10635_c0_g1_i1:64-498(+)
MCIRDRYMGKKEYLNVPTSRKLELLVEMTNMINELREDKDFTSKFGEIPFQPTEEGYYNMDEKFTEYWVEIEKNKNTVKKNSNKDFRSLHGKMIVERTKDLEGFIKEWRIHFIRSLNPQFLPKTWKVDHQFSRTFGEHSRFHHQ